jgi:hypothetical protein
MSIGFGGEKKSTYARMIKFYIVGLSTKTLRNAQFVDSTAVMTRTTTEEKAGLKMCFGTFLSFIV